MNSSKTQTEMYHVVHLELFNRHNLSVSKFYFFNIIDMKDKPTMLDEPIFDKMKTKSLWTVSSIINKMPLDLQWFIDNEPNPNCIKGAKYQDHRSLGTYDELHTAIPTHLNATYYYAISDEDYLILDIEPKCPKDILEKLLQLPYLYGERSMSGEGYHLVLPKPSNIDDYPDALIKTQLQESHGYYELLMNHYVTFTGNTIPQPTTINDFTAELYKSLAEKAVATRSIANINAELVDVDDIPFGQIIVELVLRKPFDKTPADYDEVDNLGQPKQGNKYEFGMMCYHAHRVYKCSKLDIFKQHDFGDQELLSLLYAIIKAELPPRPKHEEIRADSGGNPISFLLWRCVAAMSHTLDFYKSKEDSENKH